jgi:hypothetical protein
VLNRLWQPVVRLSTIPRSIRSLWCQALLAATSRTVFPYSLVQAANRRRGTRESRLISCRYLLNLHSYKLCVVAAWSTSRSTRRDYLCRPMVGGVAYDQHTTSNKGYGLVILVKLLPVRPLSYCMQRIRKSFQCRCIGSKKCHSWARFEIQVRHVIYTIVVIPMNRCVLREKLQ